jgi:ribosomal protein L7Ae-like RNA K-turn-binding protein
MEEKFIIASADSTHLVMQLEKICLDNKINCRIIPLPTEISANCGLSIKLKLEDKDKIIDILKNRDEEISIFYVEKNGFKKKIKKIL